MNNFWRKIFRPDPTKPFKVRHNGWTMERTVYSYSPAVGGVLEVVVTNKVFPSKEAGAAVITTSEASWIRTFNYIVDEIMTK